MLFIGAVKTRGKESVTVQYALCASHISLRQSGKKQKGQTSHKAMVAQVARISKPPQSQKNRKDHKIAEG
jgi:hypothetical protein